MIAAEKGANRIGGSYESALEKTELSLLSTESRPEGQDQIKASYRITYGYDSKYFRFSDSCEMIDA